MTGHDPLCPAIATDLSRCPQCALIAKVRADERERAATRMYLQREHIRADLRAHVEALRDEASRLALDLGGEHYFQGMGEAYQKTLATIDGDDL